MISKSLHLSTAALDIVIGLNEEKIEQIGAIPLALDERMTELREHFGLEPEDLNIDLGPLGPLLLPAGPRGFTDLTRPAAVCRLTWREAGSPFCVVEGRPVVGDVTAAFRAAVESGRLDVPVPGSGRTWERWLALADLADEDLSLARLGEGHADAVAILAEVAGTAPAAGQLWGVWAANPPGPALTAARTGTGWRLRGTKQYCSGAHTCTDALVTAAADDGMRLFAVSTQQLEPRPGTWPAVGMAASDTLDVGFPDVPAEPVGGPGAYLDRPGFSHGGVGVAACWYGGARAVGRTLLAAAGKRDVGPHALAHLGAVDIALSTARAALYRAADEIDADPADTRKAGPRRALVVRALVESAATEVLTRVGRALGAGPLCHDEAHARMVADLTVYLRQHHAERDLAALGSLAAGQGTNW